MKIYTKTGDSGTTGLFAGPRVLKDNPRIAAYGSVDELNAVLGMVLQSLDAGAGDLSQTIRLIQSDLFSIGAELATPDPAAQHMCLLPEARIGDLEDVDRCDGRTASATEELCAARWLSRVGGAALGQNGLSSRRTRCGSLVTAAGNRRLLAHRHLPQPAQRLVVRRCEIAEPSCGRCGRTVDPT